MLKGTNPGFCGHPKATGNASLAVLPASLALPLEWSRYMTLETVLALTVEKLFSVCHTEFERLMHEHQGEPLAPLSLPLPLWSATVAYVAAMLQDEVPDSDIRVVASQFCGIPVFQNRDGLFWS